jgi:hypothetical protein
MRRALLVAFLLPACFNDSPPPADAGADAVVVDAGNDAPPTDQGAPADVGADTGPEDAGQLDAGPEDVSPAADADAPAVDAGQDAGQLDAGPEDTGAVDAGQDAGRDVGVDVPRDVGVDAGPVTYDLEAERTGLEVRVVYLRTCTSRDGGLCSADAPPVTVVQSASCSRAGDRLTFSVRACPFPDDCSQLSGMFPSYRNATGAVVGVGATFSRTLRVASGPIIGGRQSFHVQLDAPPVSGSPGVVGVPGRTVDPALGDLWLLGCPVM